MYHRCVEHMQNFADLILQVVSIVYQGTNEVRAVRDLPKVNMKAFFTLPREEKNMYILEIKRLLRHNISLGIYIIFSSSFRELLIPLISSVLILT